MRFSLANLLLLCPAYLGGVLLANWWLAENRQSTDEDRYKVAMASVHHIRDSIEAAGPEVFVDPNEEKLGPLTETRVDKWLQQRLDPEDPAFEKLGDFPGRDPWGNFYVLERQTASRGEPRQLGIYSLGADGRSGSAGDDADDINTWSRHSHQYYIPDPNDNRRRDAAWIGIMFTPPIYVLLLGCVLLFRMFGSQQIPVRQPEDVIDELFDTNP